MEATPKELQIYVTEDGRTPFSEWLASLRDFKARAKIRVRLDRVGLGNLGDCHGVGDGVQELRIDYGPGCRVYFGQGRFDDRAVALWRKQEHSGQGH